jgi:hypothetical protein
VGLLLLLLLLPLPGLLLLPAIYGAASCSVKW